MHRYTPPVLHKPISKQTTTRSSKAHTSDPTLTETPFSSATDVVTDKSTGAVTKQPSTPHNSHTPDIPQGCVPITAHFKAKSKVNKSRTAPPNICTWRDNIPSTSTVTAQAAPVVTNNDNNLVALPQRPPRKRSRQSSNDTSIQSNPQCQAQNIQQPTNNVGPNVSVAPQRPPNSNANPSNVNDNSTNAKSVSFSLQSGKDEFLPIPAEGLPFFRRARGCFSAEARAHTRADHLDRLSDNGKPPRWAFGIGAMPSYVQPIARELVDIKRRHSLEITRAVARSLRDSATASQRQGMLNLDTVKGIYSSNEAGFEQASTKLTALVSRDNTQESERQSRREELISRSPTTDEDIVNLLSGFKISAKSYAGAVNNDPPQANENGNQAIARQDNNAGRPRQNAQSRSRSRSRNRNARRNDNNRRNSRSPIRPRDNRRNDDNNRQNNRAANFNGRRQDRQPQRNRFRERDNAAEIMEKMYELLKRR